MWTSADASVTAIDQVGGAEQYTVAVDVPGPACDYVAEADHLDISVRSALARNGDDYRVTDMQYDDTAGTLTATLERDSYPGTPDVTVSEGDKILRFTAYDEDDRLYGEVLDAVAAGAVPGTVTEDTVLLPVDTRLHVAAPADSVPVATLLDDRDQYITAGGPVDPEEWMYPFNLFETQPVAMPDDVYSLIRGTTWDDDARHLNSTVIDPGFSERIVTEIAAEAAGDVRDVPHVALGFYERTTL